MASTVGARINFASYDSGFGRAAQHQKLFILDRKQVFVGRDNIDNPAEADLILSVSGPIVKNLIQEAILTWQACKTYTYLPGQDSKTFVDTMLRSNEHSEVRSATVPMMVLNKVGIPLFGKYYSNPVVTGLFSAIDAAQESISIMSPNLNDKELLERLQAAASRGVTVKILVPKKYESLGSWIDRAGIYITMITRAHLPESAKQKFQIRWYSDNHSSLRANHSKFYSIDNQLTFIGSVNGDNQSLAFSRELLVAIEGREPTKKLMTEVFEASWTTSIVAKERWWHGLLPIPGDGVVKRVLTTLSIPATALKFAGKRAWNWLTRGKRYNETQNI